MGGVEMPALRRALRHRLAAGFLEVDVAVAMLRIGIVVVAEMGKGEGRAAEAGGDEGGDREGAGPGHRRISCPSFRGQDAAVGGPWR